MEDLLSLIPFELKIGLKTPELDAVKREMRLLQKRLDSAVYKSLGPQEKAERAAAKELFRATRESVYPGFYSNDPDIRRVARNRFSNDWAKSHRPSRNSTRKRYTANNPEIVAAQQSRTYENNRDKRRSTQQEWRRNNPERRMLDAAKARAKKFGIPFDIDLSDIVIPEFCPLLGIKIENGIGHGNMLRCSPSLDKIIPSLGYVKGNVRVISVRANLIKNDSTLEEMKTIVANWEKLNAEGSAK